MIEGYFEEKGLGLDLNVPPLSAFFEAASSNAKSPVSHGDMASDMATRQSQMFCLSNC